MPDVQRALLIINRVSGVGHDNALIERLSQTLKSGLSNSQSLKIEIIDNHAAARVAASDFLRSSRAPALIIAGGGGGTLRAVLEGICENCEDDELPGIERIRVGALRMGSGNVLAKQFGVPKDPLAGLAGLLDSLRENRTAPCCVMRCDAIQSDGKTSTMYAGTLGGFGQFGRVPGDLARWHHRLPTIHKLAAYLLGIERLTNVEYGLSLLTRSIWSAIHPGTLEKIEIRTADRNAETLTLLAGALLNFKLPALPFEPGIGIEDPELSLQLIPFMRRSDALRLVLSARSLCRTARVFRIDHRSEIEIRLVDRPSSEFFLDEDPQKFFSSLRLKVAGSLAFVPGPDYGAKTPITR